MMDPFEDRALDKLIQDLRQLPRAKDVTLLETAPPSGKDAGWDAVLSFAVERKRFRLIVSIKRSGYPRDIRHASQQIQAAAEMETMGDNIIPVIVAPSLSPGARALLRDHQVGYWDESGSLYLNAPGCLFYIDKPTEKIPDGTRRAKNVFRGRSAQVVHALLALHEPHYQWKLTELAEVAEVSLYTAHQVTEYLQAQLWLECNGKGPHAFRVVTDPGAILDAFADKHTLESYLPQRFFGLTKTIEDLKGNLFSELNAQGLLFAQTLETGVSLVSPHLSYQDRLCLLVHGECNMGQLGQKTGFRPVSEGENILLLTTRERSPFLFVQDGEAGPVASNIQLYIDLWNYPKRGREQARHLRRERIPY